jgi:hypothetical protein
MCSEKEEEEGMNYFLFKPFSYQNLMPMIMQIESFMG